MMKTIKFFVKKVLVLYLKFDRTLSIDLKSVISVRDFKALKGSNKYKNVINQSTISGKVSSQYGCKIQNTICTGNVEIGRFVSINGPGTRISSKVNKIFIGSFTSIGSNVIIQEDYHRFDKISTYFMNQNIFTNSIENDIFSKGPIIIEEDVWIGSNSVVLSGVKIGRGSIIGAGSIVTKDVPKYSVVAGNPAKILKKRFSDEIIMELEKTKWWMMDTNEIIKYKQEFSEKVTLNNNLF